MKIPWRKIFTILVILLFLGTIIIIALGQIDKIAILEKIP